MQKSYRLLLHNIKQLVQISEKRQLFKRMKDCDDLAVKNNYSVVIDKVGKIVKIGSTQDIDKHYSLDQFQNVVDCKNMVVIPGYVDAHTHALFAGDRSKQYEMKLNGKNYVDIYNEGLGIRYTTQSVGKSTAQQLATNLDKYIPRMTKLGTTTLQIKSGYGLDPQNQIKMLKAIEMASQKYKEKITIISTFCGAHAIPKGKTEAEQTQNVIHSQIPQIENAIKLKQINPKFIDVFCEKNFFQRQSSIKIMKAGLKIGLIPSFHGDQLSNLQSGSIASQVGAKAISHLQYLSQQSIKIMSQKQIVGVLLPTTQNIEKIPIPPIKLMRQHNMIVALGTDFCPNAFCYNMGLTAHYACTNYRLYPKQALVSATLNSAYALGLSSQVGTIQQGKNADLLILDVEDWVYVMYAFGDSYIKYVIKNGRIIN